MVEATKTQVSSLDEVDYKKHKDPLKGAVMGKVVTRFPPEPSGYLHIGHVKAAMMNYHYSRMHQGKMILRFDDTNPMNEKIEFVDNILRDLKTLGITPDEVTYSSDHFDAIRDYCKKLIQDGLAYADDTPAEEMKEQRDEGIESKHRNNTVKENLAHFQGMLEGKSVEKTVKDANGKDVKVKVNFCIRAKMDMQNKVKCLRDPVFYRCKDEKHHRTGDKYKAYPTYDLTCPIVDSIEGVTHALRTIEYRDRNALYAWVQKSLGLREVTIYDFSKITMLYTLLSKRKLRWFVEEGRVDGWNDPRFPTVQGIMRRGMTAAALRDFMLEQGPSQKNVNMEWDKIWAMNKKLLDPIVPRYTAINKATAVKLTITNGPQPPEASMQPLHMKNDSLGKKPVMLGKNLLIEKEDAEKFKEGERVTLMKWGNIKITKIIKKGDKLTEVQATYDEADKDWAGTVKITWICNDPNTTMELQMVEFDHLINKEKVEEEDKIENCVNQESKFEHTFIAEGIVRNLEKGTHFQFERKGFFFVDQIQLNNQPMIVHFIPDGKVAGMTGGKQKGGHQESATAKSKEIIPAGADGQLSKKQANKAAKKDKKAAAKAGGNVADQEERKESPQGAQSVQAEMHRVPTITSYFMGPLADHWEEILRESTWMCGGEAPSQADAEALKHLNGKWPNPAIYPNLFGWYSMCSRFTDERKAAWQAGELSIPAGYVPPQPEPEESAEPAESKQSKKEPEEEKKGAPAEKKGKQPKAQTPAPAASGPVDENLNIYKLCDLRVGKVVECVKHSNSDKLYIEQIDLGEGRIRQIGSGLQPHCTIEELLEGQVIVFANLKPKKLGGEPSEGMVMCANLDGKCELMRPPAGCTIGERIQLAGNPVDGAPLPEDFQAVLNPKKKVENKFLEMTKTNGKLEGCFNGIKMLTSKGPIKCKSLKNAVIS